MLLFVILVILLFHFLSSKTSPTGIFPVAEFPLATFIQSPVHRSLL